ncbi:MAG: dioxygenase [Gammaproteobacteria bacterium]|jgi:catechol 1,2-dioxygenase/hydroxyquinol 1,2-dioxygenase
MPAITLENITDAVINHGDKGKTNPRLHEIYSSLVKHLHAFQREVNLTTEELDIGRQFLFKLATPNQDFPNGEIHLMTDCLGISEVSILLEDNKNHGTTEMNVEGPLFIEGLPERANGALVGEIGANDKPLFVTNKFQDKHGKPLANAIVDVWQPDGDGFYFVQRDYLPKWNFYGRFHTDASGNLNFATVVPGDYPVPTSGPTGSMLQQLGRHGYRAAHIHYIVRATGHDDFTTMMYFNHSPYVDSDTIFSVKDFRVDIVKHDNAAELKARGLDKPFYTLEYTFVIP